MAADHLSYRRWLEEHRPGHIELSVEQVVQLLEHSTSRKVEVDSEGKLKIKNIITGDVDFRHSIEFVVVYEPIIEGQKVVYWRPTMSDDFHKLIGGLPRQQTIESWLGELGIHGLPEDLQLPEMIVSLPLPAWVSGEAETMFQNESARQANLFKVELEPHLNVRQPSLWYALAFVVIAYIAGLSTIVLEVYFNYPIIRFLNWLIGG